MDAEQVGSFRTRPTGDGSLEVWARGWRLDSPLYALIPAGLAVMFVLAPMPIVMKVIGAAILLAAGVFVFRLTKPGLRFAADAVTIVGVVRTQVFPWESIGGFMGERRHDEGRILLVLADDTRVPLPGTLDPGELDPYGEEGEMLSAVDQLNRMGERARSGGLPKATVSPSRAPAPRDELASRKGRRSERKELKAALKTVRHPEVRRAAAPTTEKESKEEETPSRRLLRRRAKEPAEALTPVAIAEAPAAAPAAARPEPTPAATARASFYPTPTYIPQAEYARMLREQKAAEKAAAAAAAELAELADLDELAEKDEFSDWTE
jgi:hypothetical protein